MNHPLHITIGKIINEEIFPKYMILRDRACGGEQYIPLFSSEDKLNRTKYCNVDLMIHESNKIRVIIEIEESDVTPWIQFLIYMNLGTWVS